MKGRKKKAKIKLRERETVTDKCLESAVSSLKAGKEGD